MLHAAALWVFGRLPRLVRTRIVRTLYPTFTAGVGVVMVRPDGRFCLVRHSYSTGWGIPGGMIDRDEQPGQTAVRELREELAVDLEVGRHAIPIRTPGRKHFNYLYRVAVDDTLAASARANSPEIVAVDWFAPAALPELAEFTELFLAELDVVPAPSQSSAPM